MALEPELEKWLRDLQRFVESKNGATLDFSAIINELTAPKLRKSGESNDSKSFKAATSRELKQGRFLLRTIFISLIHLHLM